MTKPRTKFLDYDARRTPKTDFSCAMCQRDLDPRSSKVRWIRLVDEVLILHPADDALYAGGDAGQQTLPVGPECVRKIGVEWTRPRP